MPRKSVKKSSKSTRKLQTKRKTSKKSEQDQKIERVLVENFTSLQNVMTDLSIKINDLTDKLNNLLDIFEQSAETIARRDFKAEQKTHDTDKILEGIKNLSEQNKIIAKGLTLIHENPKTQELEEIPNTTKPLPEKPLNQPFPKPENKFKKLKALPREHA